MKSYGVTIQVKPLQQYFCMVPFVFNIFKTKFVIFLECNWFILLYKVALPVGELITSKDA